MGPVPASALRRIVSLHMEENAPPYARFFSLAISSDLVFPSSPPSAGPDNRA